MYIVDRYKDMYISGGENVYPAEVEQVIYQLPEVGEVAVIGVPDDRWGEVVHAVVVPRPEQEVDAATLMTYCRAYIAGYKVPKSIDFQTDPLPKSGPGKILKRELRAPYWEGHEAQIH